MLSYGATDLSINPVVVRTYEDLSNFNLENPLFNLEFSCFANNTGDIGIWATHYLSYKKFLNSDKKYLIMVEDDAVLYDNFFDLLNFYVKEVPSDFDVLYLDSPDSGIFSVYGNSYDFYKTESIYISHSTHWFGGITMLISRLGAKNIINYIENNTITQPFDYEILESDPPSSIIHSNSNGRLTISITGLIPKNKNKKFMTYSLSPYSQKIASSVFSESLIRKVGK